MKKILNGKKYDTDTAIRVCTYDNGIGWGDFRAVLEILYRKKTGEFFIHGEGGPMTRWSRSCGDNSWCGGEGIEPITEQEAKEFFEEHGDVDKYESIFGPVPE